MPTPSYYDQPRKDDSSCSHIAMFRVRKILPIISKNHFQIAHSVFKTSKTAFPPSSQTNTYLMCNLPAKVSTFTHRLFRKLYLPNRFYAKSSFCQPVRLLRPASPALSPPSCSPRKLAPTVLLAGLAAANLPAGRHGPLPPFPPPPHFPKFSHSK